MLIFEKEYDGESLIDIERDLEEAFNPRFNPLVNYVPVDQYGFHKGTFKMIIEWREE